MYDVKGREIVGHVIDSDLSFPSSSPSSQENATICYQLFICDSIATANPVLKVSCSEHFLCLQVRIQCHSVYYYEH